MKVKELMEELNKYDKESKIYIDGRNEYGGELDLCINSLYSNSFGVNIIIRERT